MDIDKLRKRIDKAVVEAKRTGWGIQPGMFVSRCGSHCCPLGSVYLKEMGSPDPTDISGFLAYRCEDELPIILNMCSDEVYSFADGYDGIGYDNKKHVFKLWNLGRSYRSKYPYKSED